MAEGQMSAAAAIETASPRAKDIYTKGERESLPGTPAAVSLFPTQLNLRWSWPLSGKDTLVPCLFVRSTSLS